MILDWIFMVAIPLSMIISVFSLGASMTVKIHSQTKEIAVLRSIGLTKRAIIKIYLYESFILVGISSLIGIFIGIFMGWLLA